MQARERLSMAGLIDLASQQMQAMERLAMEGLTNFAAKSEEVEAAKKDARLRRRSE
jgi:hypothetical protein